MSDLGSHCCECRSSRRSMVSSAGLCPFWLGLACCASALITNAWRRGRSHRAGALVKAVHPGGQHRKAPRLIPTRFELYKNSSGVVHG